ncbi:MAG: hypothetical protein ABEK00_02370, partial [Candidatus Nanohaloarchaea archaeon]
MEFRKGITPVVAVTLLMGIAVAATGTLYYQIKNVQGQVDQNTNVFEQSRLTIESCNTKPSESVLYIRNSNTKAINTSLLRVYVNSRPVQDSEHEFRPDIVDPQRDFNLTIQKNLDRSDVVRIEGRNNEFTYRCL